MLRSDLIASLQLKVVPVPVNGVPLFVRPWKAGERAEFLTWRKANPGYVGLCEKLFVLSACDAEGKRVFDDSPESLAMVTDLDGVVVQKVAEKAIALNGLGDDSPKD